ncbi:MAG: HEAT repeat domain-containing protein [Candidatus Sulfopaludibacter sp.]|nr:HEAT repeat domain-containing protein [Candidatus Sulfopaludibacter sp.]
MEAADLTNVAATASLPPRPPDDLNASLQALVRHFDHDAAENRKLIRELLERDRDAFYSSALDILRTQSDSRGCQYLVTLFVAYDLLRRALCDPLLTRPQALTLARAAMRIDSMTDVSLAKALAESFGDEGEPIPAEHAARLMAVLSEISDGSRIQSSLMRLLRHPNPYLRSKAVKMIGRGSRSVRWVQNRLQESDPRVRANAIESIWGLDSEEARALLLTTARDANNRVAGNALAALYRLGDHRVIPDVIKMAEHESALFRSTAAWVMGESGDPRFTETLARMLRDSDQAVRTRSLSALGRIKNAVAQSRLNKPWVVTGRMFLETSSKANRRLQVAVAGAEDQVEPQILPTQLTVLEDGQAVMEYKMNQKAAVEAMSVVFAVSRDMVRSSTAWWRGVAACRSWKRPSDLWAVSAYLAGEGEDGNSGPAEEPLSFVSGADSLDKALAQPEARSECTELWRTVLRAVRSDQGQNRGKRHLILFSHSDPYRSAGEGLVSTVLSSRASVQVISAAPSPKVEDFCRRARASFQIAQTDDEIARCLELAYLNLLARYEITWNSPQADTADLKVRINTPAGWGEASIPVRQASA